MMPVLTALPGLRALPWLGAPAARGAWTADLDPGADEARQWVADELAKDEYHDGRSILERVMQWIAERVRDLQDAQHQGPGVGLPPIVTALLVVLLLAAVVWVLTKVRVEQRTLKDRTPVLGDSVLSSEQFRSRGEQAFGEGRWGDAVLDYTRAIARSADDRTLLTDAPGLTAREIGVQLTEVFPAHAGRVIGSTDLFDAVLYGRLEANRQDAELVRSTDEALKRSRPALPGHGDAEETDPGTAAAQARR